MKIRKIGDLTKRNRYGVRGMNSPFGEPARPWHGCRGMLRKIASLASLYRNDGINVEDPLPGKGWGRCKKFACKATCVTA